MAPDVRLLIVVANSPLAPEVERDLAAASAPTAFAVLRPGGNVGLGEAYNRLVERAEAEGARFLFLLDQDSLPPTGTVPILLAAHSRLEAAGKRPAIVGPHPAGSDGAPVRIYARRGVLGPPGLAPVAFAISSGSLVDLGAARAIGPFRADFFIDAIDVEWGMRAWARGFSIWMASDAPMPHRLGRGIVRAAGLLLADQPPSRLYTFFRNQVVMLRLAHVPFGHKARFLVSLPLRVAIHLAHDRGRAATRRAILRGLLDGARNSLGPPPGPHPRPPSG